MKQKQRIALFGMVAVALIFAACGGDSGNNGTEVEGGNSSSGEISSSVEKYSSSSAKVQSNFSVPESSSSAKLSSSSPAVSGSGAKAAWDYLNPNITYGEMTDPRDRQTYKTVVIGTQTWMAENLNYADSVAMPNLAGNSWCYGNSLDSCAKYGRLYTWTGAMNIESSYQSVTASSVISTSQQGACPTDWHVPTDAEWTTLETAVGGSSTAGTALKSTGGWYSDGNGTDAYGFSVLPAGSRNYGDFYGAGYSAYFWSATEYDAIYAYFRYLYYDLADMYSDYDSKHNAFSVRCVKDL